MSDFALQIDGVPRVTQQIRSIGPEVRRAITAAVRRSTVEVMKLAKQKVSGSVLKNRTGTLRRKINQHVTVLPNAVIGRVGISLAYAAAHEFGFHKTVTVKAHLRMMTMAWGRPVREPRQIQVGEHPMKMNLPERSFLRSSLKEQSDSIVASMRAALRGL